MVDELFVVSTINLKGLPAGRHAKVNLRIADVRVFLRNQFLEPVPPMAPWDLEKILKDVEQDIASEAATGAVSDAQEVQSGFDSDAGHGDGGRDGAADHGAGDDGAGGVGTGGGEPDAHNRVSAQAAAGDFGGDERPRTENLENLGFRP